MQMKSPSNSRVRIAVGLFFFVMGLTFASWTSRLIDVKTKLNLNDAQLGTLLLAAPFGQIPAILISGFLVKWFGSKNIVLFSALFYPLVLVLLGLAPAPIWLFMTLFCFGLAGNIFDIAVNTQAVAVEKNYGRSILSSFHGLWSLGGLVGVLVGSTMAVHGIVPPCHFLCILALSAVIFGGLKNWLLPQNIHGNGGAPTAQIADKSYRLSVLGLIALAAMATEGIIYNWSAIYWSEVLHAPLQWVRVGYICGMVAMVLGRFTADRMIACLGHLRVLQLGGLFIGVGTFTILLAGGLASAAIGFACIGFGMSSGVPICFSLAGQSKRLPPSFAIASVTAISFLGFLLAPPFIGYLSHFFCLKTAFCTVFLFGLAILILPNVLEVNENQKTKASK